MPLLCPSQSIEVFFALHLLKIKVQVTVFSVAMAPKKSNKIQHFIVFFEGLTLSFSPKQAKNELKKRQFVVFYRGKSDFSHRFYATRSLQAVRDKLGFIPRGLVAHRQVEPRIRHWFRAKHKNLAVRFPPALFPFCPFCYGKNPTLISLPLPVF